MGKLPNTYSGAQKHNVTVGASFGTMRELAFVHNESNVKVNIPLPNNSAIAYGENVNLAWKVSLRLIIYVIIWAVSASMYSFFEVTLQSLLQFYSTVSTIFKIVVPIRVVAFRSISTVFLVILWKISNKVAR